MMPSPVLRVPPRWLRGPYPFSHQPLRKMWSDAGLRRPATQVEEGVGFAYMAGRNSPRAEAAHSVPIESDPDWLVLGRPSPATTATSQLAGTATSRRRRSA